MVSGSSGVYMFVFSIYFYFVELKYNDLSSLIIYFSRMILLSGTFALMTGAIGVLSSFKFNTYIYS